MKKLLFTLLFLNSLFVHAQKACGDTLIDARDGKKYRTISIGNQCWMRDNLDYGVFLTSSTLQSNNGIVEKYAYNNDTTNCPQYGALYQWNEAMNYTTTIGTQGVCPNGWHLPSDAEWQTLEITLGMTAGQANTNTNFRGTNQGAQLIVGGTSNFDAKYAGVYDAFYQTFQGLSNYTLFWTSTLESAGYPYRRGIYNVDSRVYRGSGNVSANIDYGYSVRCVSNTLKITTSNPDPNIGQGIKIYPIPANHQLFIERDNTDTTISSSYEIFDSFGRIIKANTFNQAVNRVDITELENGVYTVKILSASGDITIKKIEVVN